MCLDFDPDNPETMPDWKPPKSSAQMAGSVHSHCPNCGAWTQKTVAENVLSPSYDYCPQCHWTNRPIWKLG